MQTKYELSPAARRELANALPDTPETVITISQLRAGRARAWRLADTLIVEDLGQPGEPMAFSENAAQIVALLAHVPNWFCVNVAAKLAAPVAARLGRRCRLQGDVYHTLTTPAPPLAHPAVRRLTPADAPLLPPSQAHLRLDGIAFGAVVDGHGNGNGRLLSIAHNYARTPRFGDIGVFTALEGRGQGLATVCATAVARALQAEGVTPVWSCGENNPASLRVAQKMGFTKVSTRVYVIPDANDE